MQKEEKNAMEIYYKKEVEKNRGDMLQYQNLKWKLHANVELNRVKKTRRELMQKKKEQTKEMDSDNFCKEKVTKNEENMADLYAEWR